MRNKVGLCFLFLGVLLLCGSLSLYLSNQQEDHHAQEESVKSIINLCLYLQEEKMV